MPLPKKERGDEGMLPNSIEPNGKFTAKDYSFASHGDSFYEYLLKAWIANGKDEADLRLLDTWRLAMNTMRKKLLFDAGGSMFLRQVRGGVLIVRLLKMVLLS